MSFPRRSRHHCTTEVRNLGKMELLARACGVGSPRFLEGCVHVEGWSWLALRLIQKDP